MTALSSRSFQIPHAGFTLARFTSARADKAAALLCMAILVVNAAMPDERDAEDTTSAAASAASRVVAMPGAETAYGFYFGAPYHYPSDLKAGKSGLHDLTIKNIEWYTHPFEHPLYYGARIQRWLDGGRFGTMIDFTHSKAYAPLQGENDMQGTYDGKPAPQRAKIKSIYDRLEFTHGHNMLTLNGLVRVFGFSNRIAPYAGLGAGISLPHAESRNTTDAARTYEYQYAGPNAQALFGVEFRLKSGSIFVEYKFTIADYMTPVTYRDGTWFPIDMWRQFSRWWSGQEPPGGWLSTRLTSHQVISGILLRPVPASAKVAK